MDKNPFAIPFTNRRYLDAVEDHVVVFDGAVGTELAKAHLTAADFGGERTEGLMEMLLFHRPEVVEAAHAAYLQAGAEVLETNSFRANRITLGEFGVGEHTLEINRAAAVLARRVADRVQAETGLPRFVAGSMGPTGKLPSLDDPELSDVTFDTLVDVFAEQAQGLIEGGVDLLLIETQQDLLELKAAIHGIWRAFTALGVRLPIQAQMTLDASGHMLSGPDVEAALVAIAALPADVIGMNCSTGPEEMRESVRRLLALTNRPVSVLPNAGMPENVGGRAVYRMDPVPFAGALAEFVRWGVRVVGGCCGTGPAHVAAIRATLEREGLIAHRLPERVAAAPLPYAASNIQAVALHQDPRPLLVGERINTQGSKQARELVLGERYDALVELAETQVGYGAHLLDVCLALTERADEPETMRRVVKQLSLNTPAPLMIDTTDPEVMQAALEIYPGRAVINSVHLEGGEARARRIMTLARDFGAALVALTIDETGMAKTVARKLAVARRLYDLAVTEVGLPPHALIFDPLTFTLATGDPETANAAVETLEALRQLKVALPGVLTSLGVSNVSFGLTPPARRSLNSVFLYQAAVAGLDMAIVNPAQITPYPDIPAEVREAADALIFNRDPDALARYLSCFEGAGSAPAEAEVSTALPAHEQLFQAILHRRREGVEALVEGSLEHFAPLAVLNEILLPAMKEVGDRFGSGELILPFVLKSAEVMRAAVGHLEQYLDRVVGTSRGTVVLATVFGDVHDIGKNLVKTVLVNNGYTVHDLGKQVPVEAVIDKAVEVHADAIGLSALLVATSQQMKLAVESLQRRGLAIPVLIGGAAINPSFAERIALDAEGRPYAGGVHYCKDAFAALTVLGELGRRPQPEMSGSSTAIPAQLVPEADLEPDSSDAAVYACSCCTPAAPSLRPSAQIPVPPFWGVRHLPEIALETLWPFLDRKSLFRVSWGVRGATGERWETLQAEMETRLAAMWPDAGAYLKPQAIYGYFPAQSEGNDLVIYDPAAPADLREIARFSFPRQPKGLGLCLADYFAPVGGAVPDVAAFQVVTVGAQAAEQFGALDEAGAYSEAYFVHGLASQVTEAAAEWVHHHIREELGLPPEQGKRYSWGYPACPDLEGHRLVFGLLPAEALLGMGLSSAAQLLPEHSTAALVVHHPAARYFSTFLEAQKLPGR